MLKISNDSKTRCHKNQKNAFGLLPGPEGTCPCATTENGGCWYKDADKKIHTCYVDKLMTARPNVYNTLKYNTDLLKQSDFVAKVELLNNMVAKFRRANKDVKHNLFRLHWAGDIYNVDYAKALRQVILTNDDITFWTYTRSLFALPYLSNIVNLSLYVSIDPCNFNDGVDACYTCNKMWGDAIQEYSFKSAAPLHNLTPVKLAYMNTINDFDARFARIAHKYNNWKPRLTACPVDSKTVIYKESCYKCKLCLKPQLETHIYFKTK